MKDLKVEGWKVADNNRPPPNLQPLIFKPIITGAFTLIEVLVAGGVIALLLSVLLPGLSAAREQARAVACRSNIRQVVLANGYYAHDHNGAFCPGASDAILNLNRWHGARDRASDPFDSRRGPLVSYLGPDASIRRCPTFPSAEIAATNGGFEQGNGGYGYNNAFVGVRLTEFTAGRSSNAPGAPSSVYEVIDDRTGAFSGRIHRPADTVMFTDAAFAADGLIEYSFAEPRFHPQYADVRAVPSIHFRHRGLANVAWCDGHVDARRLTFTQSSPLYRGKPERFGIGWFGEADDNRLFDLK